MTALSKPWLKERANDMKRAEQWMGVLAILGSLVLAACQHKKEGHTVEHPAEVEAIEGSDLKRVTLTPRAMERIDVKTDKVREERPSASAAPQRVVPYSSLIYDPMGRTWVYTSPEERSFVRHEVQVDRIAGDRVFLKDGPAAGTVVASMAVAELYGTEFKVGH